MPIIDAEARILPGAAPPDEVLAPDARLEAVLPRLAAARVIAINFPQFRDGRGFTLARALRQHGYRGDLRATGHFLPDQFRALKGCGFTSFEPPLEHAPAQFAAALAAPHQPGQLLRRTVTRAREAG